MKNIAIIGGDLSGVSCAYFLDKLSGVNSKKFNIDLIEKDLEFANDRFGKFQFGQEIYDNGWHNSISEQGVLFYLMIELGLHRYLIKSGMTKKVFFTKEGIKYLPEKMLYGLPLDKRELLLSDLFTFKEKLSILYNMYNTLEDEDIKELTVEEFFRAIVNEKIYVKLIEPLLTSYYASDISKQSMVSLMPELSFLTIQKEDINKVLEEMYDRNVIDNITVGAEYRLKFTLKSFIETLESNFSDKVFLELNRKVEKIEKRGDKYLVHSNGSIYYYDYIILTLNQKNFLPWFNDDEKIIEFYSDMNREIGEIIFPKDESEYVTKLEYVSNKWIDIKMSGIQIVRAYISREEAVKKLIDKSDSEIKEIVEKELIKVHGVVGNVNKYYVSKIKDNYRFCCREYNKRINEFNEYMRKQYPNVFIIGKSKKGTTLENTVLEAKEIAKEILENIR